MLAKVLKMMSIERSYFAFVPGLKCNKETFFWIIFSTFYFTCAVNVPNPAAAKPFLYGDLMNRLKLNGTFPSQWLYIREHGQ